jgi:hypothetical protein
LRGDLVRREAAAVRRDVVAVEDVADRVASPVRSQPSTMTCPVSSGRPAATIALYRLHAGSDRLLERIRRRGVGDGPPIAGDDLRGQLPAAFDRAHRAAVAQAESLERSGIGEIRVDTDGRAVEDLAEEIVRGRGW